jgi:mono/diheme cytochrome c family protein
VTENSRQLSTVILGVVLVAVASGAVLFLRSHSPTAMARKMKNPVVPTAEVLASGKQSYAQHCQKCHGEKGDGRGEKAPELSVEPTDFTKAKVMGELADGQLFMEITKGELPMPAFEDKLSDQQRWELVDYVRTFANSTGPSLAR